MENKIADNKKNYFLTNPKFLLGACAVLIVSAFLISYVFHQKKEALLHNNFSSGNQQQVIGIEDDLKGSDNNSVQSPDLANSQTANDAVTIDYQNPQSDIMLQNGNILKLKSLSVSSQDIQNGAVTSRTIKNHTIKGEDISSDAKVSINKLTADKITAKDSLTADSLISDGLTLDDNIPQNTSNTLYNSGGQLYWNGTILGSGGGGTTYYNGDLLNLTGATFSVKHGTLTDGNLCAYSSSDGLVCSSSGTYGINISGNAATVTNGLYSTGSYSNPSWLAQISGAIVNGNILGNAATATLATSATSATTAGSITGSLPFSQLGNPTQNAGLSMGSNSATFTYGNNTGSDNLFNLLDTLNNTGTGYLLNIATANPSLLNPLHVSSSGIEALTINSSGLVGIGTNSPHSKLSVSGGATFGSGYSGYLVGDGDVAIQNALGIGTQTIDGSAAFQINSTTQGLLLPRMTTTQRNAISSPAQGLQVYDTTLNQNMYYNGSMWNGLASNTVTNVKDHGAYGDVRNFADGIVTASSATFTSATANFTPADTGKYIIISGAGAGLAAPVISSVTPTGTDNGVTRTYVVTALTASGETLSSDPVSNAHGATTLTSSNYETIAWNAITGALGYNVYRTAGGTIQGKINLVPITGTSTTDTSNDLPLLPPSIMRTSPVGTGGSTAWTYKVVAVNAAGHSLPSANGSTGATGNATLTTTNYNEIVWSPVIGATSYQVWRTSGTTGMIGTTDQYNCLFMDTGGAVSPSGSPTNTNTSYVATPGTNTSPQPLIATITYVNSTTVTLSTAATNTVSGATFYYGHDDVTAINSTMASGGNIYIPAGTYFISSSLVVPSLTNLYGAGSGITTIIPVPVQSNYSFANTSLAGANTIAMIATFATDKTNIHDMTLNAYIPTFNGSGIQMGWYLSSGLTTNSYVHNMEFIWSDPSGTSPQSNVMVWPDRVTGFWVYNNIFNGNDPIARNSSYGSLGMELVGTSDGVISGNTFSNMYIGINGFYGNAGFSVRNVSVLQNIFDTMQLGQSHYVTAPQTLVGYLSEQNVHKNMFSNAFGLNASSGSLIQSVSSVGDYFNNGLTNAISAQSAAINLWKNVSFMDFKIANFVNGGVSISKAGGVTLGGYDIFNISAGYGIAIASGLDTIVNPGKIDTSRYSGVYAYGGSNNLKISGVHTNYVGTSGGGASGSPVQIKQSSNVDITNITAENPYALTDYVVYLDPTATIANVRASGNRAMYAAANGTVFWGNATHSSWLTNNNLGYFACTASTTATVNNTLVTPTSQIRLMKTGGTTDATYNIVPAAGSFVVTFSATMATSDTFEYEVVQ
jgi:hypothetical protein